MNDLQIFTPENRHFLLIDHVLKKVCKALKIGIDTGADLLIYEDIYRNRELYNLTGFHKNKLKDIKKRFKAGNMNLQAFTVYYLYMNHELYFRRKMSFKLNILFNLIKIEYNSN